MDEILKKLSSLDFFISVIVVSIVLNIISTYLKNFLDKGISKLNSSYKNKIDLLKAEEENFNNILLGSEEFRNIHRDEAIFERIRSTWFLIFSIFIFILVAITKLLENTLFDGIIGYALFIGFLSLILSMKYILSSSKKWNRAFEASRIKKH